MKHFWRFGHGPPLRQPAVPTAIYHTPASTRRPQPSTIPICTCQPSRLTTRGPIFYPPSLRDHRRYLKPRHWRRHSRMPFFDRAVERDQLSNRLCGQLKARRWTCVINFPGFIVENHRSKNKIRLYEHNVFVQTTITPVLLEIVSIVGVVSYGDSSVCFAISRKVFFFLNRKCNHIFSEGQLYHHSNDNYKIQLWNPIYFRNFFRKNIFFLQSDEIKSRNQSTENKNGCQIQHFLTLSFKSYDLIFHQISNEPVT